MTDLVRALKLSRATCHALLTGLVDVGYLYRTSDKTYVLGPALAAIGRTAVDNFSPLQVAQPEMRNLADEFDVVCGAYFLEGDMIHLRERAASLSHVGYPVPMGTRMPMRWVQAISYLARSPRDVEMWLARTDSPPSAEQIAQMEKGMAFVREYGFIPLLRRPGAIFPGEPAAIGAVSNDPPIVPETEFEDDRSYPLMAIMAPIHDDRDRATISIVMAGFPDMVAGSDIHRAGGKLAEACQRISRFLSRRTEEAA